MDKQVELLGWFAMPLFSRKKDKGSKKDKKEPPKEEKTTENPAAGEDEDEDEAPTQEDLMGDQSWAKTSEDDFTNEVEAMFAMMKETMGPAPTGPEVKMGALGDGQAGVDDVEAEPEPEPEPKPRPVRVKLTKEEKMAKMKAMGEKRKAEGAMADDDADAQALARCEELFNKYDADGGGTIDASELQALCFDMGMTFEDEADKQLVLSMLDTDGDGEVSMDEFKVWWLANSETFFVKEYSENVKAAIHFFKKFDDDLSGELDQMEFVAMCKEMGWNTRDTAMSLVMLDTDGDGMISFQEFLAWYSDDGMTKNLMKVYNTRHCDSLNLVEFTALAKDWKLDEATAAKVFKKYDKDKDGELNMEELKVVIEKTKS